MRQNPYILNYKKICKNNGIEFYKCKNKGIYLLESNDLLNWTLVHISIYNMMLRAFCAVFATLVLSAIFSNRRQKIVQISSCKP